MNRITLPVLFLFALTAGLLSSCSYAIKVSTFKEEGINLSNYKTYAWAAPGDTTLNTLRDDKIFAAVIVNAADVELKKKGMKVDNQNPDVVFIFDSKIEEQVVYRESTSPNPWLGYSGYGYGYGYMGPGYYMGTNNLTTFHTETHSTLIDQGMLGYTMYDRKTGKLLWRGVATQKISKNPDIEKSIKKATKNIFAKLRIYIKK
jgi:hypothetical protein